MALAASITLLFSIILLWSPQVLLSTGQALALLVAAGLLAAGCGGVRAVVVTVAAGLPLLATVASLNGLLRERWPAASTSTETLVSGSVCEFPRVQPGVWRFLLTTDSESRSRGVPGRVLVSWYDGATQPASPPQPGEKWRLSLRLRPPRGLSNPGGFDFEQWLFSQHTGATAWVRDSAANARLPGLTAVCPLAGWRTAIARKLAPSLAGRESGPYVLGLAIGAYQTLPEAEWDKLRRTGTIHLISISGFHIALVAGPAALLGLLLGRLLLGAGLRCRPRVLAAGTALLIACLYGGLAGFSVPTARSVVAVAVMAALTSWRRKVTAPDLAASVILGVLLLEPLAPLAPGFWLSFAGVAVLAAAGLVLRPGSGKPGVLRLFLLTQAGMTLGLAPLLVLFFGQVPLSGALANMLAVPAFSLVLLPLTLLGTAATMLAPGVGGAILGLAANCFDLWRVFLDWCSRLPLAVWYLPEPSSAALLLAAAGSVVALWPVPWPARWFCAGLLTALAAPVSAPVPAGGLRLTVLDVGQGLAVLLQTAGHSLLYDTGPAFRNSDAGERVVVPALQALDVARLDTLLISHADADHRGGAASVLERFPPDRLLGTPVAGKSAIPCVAGTGWHWDGFTFEILHPVVGAELPDDNAHSCVLRVSGPGASLLLPGDIAAPVERTLVTQPDFRPLDLVVAPHHGSRTSSSPAFVQALRPSYVVFSTGHRNRWHFPAAEVVARWQASGACVLDTAEEGALQFEVAPGSTIRLVRRQRSRALGVWLARPAHSALCQ